ncbi:MAG: pitrilysin family protein [Bacteroidota bacterium]
MQLREGIPLFVLDRGIQPIIKLEVLFESGTWYEPQHGVAYFTANMLREGTQKRNAREIAAYVDQYGANLDIDIKPDYCSIELTTLSKHLSPMLALLAEILLEPTFPAEQLCLLQNLKTQAIKIEDEQYNQVARKQFRAIVLGKQHPYGRSLTAEAIAAITPEHLQQYYKERLLAGCRILMSGQVSDQDIQAVQHHLQHLPRQQPATIHYPLSAKATAKVHIPKAGSLQSSINIGKILFTKDHPDYLPMHFFSELLGGYFGSRLMRNIREEKGYTYGIHAKIIPLKHISYFLITTEVVLAFSEQACHEIYQEIKALQTQEVPQEELQKLRSYLIGTFLAAVSDPFAIMEKFKEAHLYGLGSDFYKQFYDTVSHISASQIRKLANQYLAIDSLSEVRVG